jgi:hypothetical protein
MKSTPGNSKAKLSFSTCGTLVEYPTDEYRIVFMQQMLFEVNQTEK